MTGKRTAAECPASLRSLAADLRARAADIDALAARLARHPGKQIRVLGARGVHEAVRDGLVLFIRDCDRKATRLGL